MRRLLLFPIFCALCCVGCSRATDEPIASAEAPPAPMFEHSDRAEAMPASAKPADTPENAQRELEFVKKLARLSEAAEQHIQRGYFDQAVAARQESLTLIEAHYGKDAWQARSARLATNHAIRLQALSSAQRTAYLATVADEARAQDKWSVGARAAAFDAILHARDGAQKLWGPSDYTVGNLIDQEAEWRQSTGELAKAEQLAKQALALREQIFTREHPDTVTSISRLGLTLQLQKRYQDAEPLLQEAVTRSGALFGENHLEYARHLNNLGMLAYDRANLPLAIETLNKALAIRQKFLPADDPLIAHSLFNLGSAYYASKNYAEATPRLQQALAIFDKSMSPTHSITRLARLNLGMSLMAEKKYAETEAVFQKDYDLAARAYGDNSPIVAESMLRLGVLFGNQGRYSEADPLISRAAAIERAALGADHPATKQAEQLAEQVHARLAKTTTAPKEGVIQAAAQSSVPTATPEPAPALTPIPSSAGAARAP